MFILIVQAEMYSERNKMHKKYSTIINSDKIICSIQQTKRKALPLPIDLSVYREQNVPDREHFERSLSTPFYFLSIVSTQKGKSSSSSTTVSSAEFDHFMRITSHNDKIIHTSIKQCEVYVLRQPSLTKCAWHGPVCEPHGLATPRFLWGTSQKPTT